MNGVVDYRGRPATKASSGGWTSALFIIGVEIAERFVYFGVSSNLITYLTVRLHESTAGAAAAVNVWNGVSSMLPLLGAFLADSYLGRYRTIVVASVLYIVAIGLLCLSTLLHPPECEGVCKPSSSQVIMFYFSLYLVALAAGGHKPCVQAFGADQFDPNDSEERIQRSAFFNWWYFGMCMGVVVALIILSYVQDNIGWALGFGIPGIVMFCALFIFLLGTRTYRFYPLQDESPFARLTKALLAQLRSGSGNDDNQQRRHSESMDEVKKLLRLFPIWATCLMFAVAFVQSPTLFTKQGATLDRKISGKLEVPPAALQAFIGISIVVFIPIYDRILVPVARKFSNHPSGITVLQRIGTGLVISLISMVTAALVEKKRLQTAREFSLVDNPKAVIPMSLWWLVPQYVLFGIADAFTVVGLQEFFYSQVSCSLRSMGVALQLSIFGIGSFISGFLILLINHATNRGGEESWFAKNMNQAHLDYFYWLLAGLSILELALFFYFSKAYVYNTDEDIRDV